MPTGIKYTKQTASSVSCTRRQHQYFGVNRYLGVLDAKIDNFLIAHIKK